MLEAVRTFAVHIAPMNIFDRLIVQGLDTSLIYTGITLALLGIALLIALRNAELKANKSRKELAELVELRTRELSHINELLKQEIIERTLVEDAFAVRLRYEEALANCSHVFLTNTRGALGKSLAYLRAVSGSCCVSFYKNMRHDVDKLSMELLENTCLDEAKFGMPSEPVIIPYFPDHTWLFNMLSNDHVISSKVSDLPEVERNRLAVKDVFFIVSVAVKVYGEFYGALEFYKSQDDRKWEDDEIAMMETAATNIGSYVERNLAEKELQMAKETAEKAYAKLTATNLQLQSAREESEKANLGKTQFLTNVSHEMRTPLNCIIGFAEAIMRAASLEESQAKSETLLTEAETLLLLINDLLDHAKIEAGKMDMEYRRFDLNFLLDSVQDSIHPQIKRKNLDFELNIADDVPMFLIGDSLRLKQILMNLVGNAIKFTDSGYIAINIVVESSNEYNNNIVFSVVDSGIGISEQKQPLIFNTFTQADGSTTRKYGGTGLGVSISKQLVEKMGGEIGLYSRFGSGTTFWFKIPFVLASDSDISELKKEQMSKDDTDDIILQGNVLLAEDYPSNQEIVKLHLEAAGIELDIVDTGFKAITCADSKKYDLILMDVQMPEMDGFEASKRIRAGSGPCKDVPIVALTANANALTRKMCKDAGMDDVITKPIKRLNFLKKISRWLTSPDIAKVDAEVAFQGDKFEIKESENNGMIFNYDQILEEFGGNKKLLDDLLSKFLELADAQLFIIRTAAVECDSEKLRAESHKLKGGAANLSAERVALAAEKIERCAEAQRIENAMELVFELEEAFAELKEAILNIE